MPKISPDRISFRATCLRALAYLLIIAALMEGVMQEAQQFVDVRFSESGFTELTQSFLLLLATGLALSVRVWQRQLPNVALLLVGLLGASFIREQDAWLDTYVFDGAWQTLVTLLVLPVLFVVIRHRRAFVAELESITGTFSFGLFAAGFLTTYAFSRLYGRSELWQAILGDHYLRIIKDAAEEVTELFGYTLLLFAMLELVLLVRRRLAAER
ncbi:hypothetical protein [Halomonas caseinilytica]|uniref:Uncharacterized protein n=1 Tax=Halomonas caseinilytica TaxID=438744 RepID=A0A1M6SVX0_9GAMM|nr:hypothetical protein [Halomonas caseinilytica]SEM61216.1 hypothetical protein SAMN04487952_105132 [Halomonas caseinilytica]SHK48892.1 hypothetical protein SAMN05192556_103132 [Halomonas caseinilytica]